MRGIMDSESERAYQSERDGREVDRRTFFSYLFAAIAAFITAALAIPLAGAAILPTLRRREVDWLDAGPVDSFPTGQPRTTQLTLTRRDGWIAVEEPKSIWVIRDNGNDFTVFNARCTHLGCAFSWQEGQQRFVCPCHGGIFAADGAHVAGPPPRGLDTMEWRVDNGALMVAYQDFRLGIGSKEAI
jgi:menaquinol-cytochrome c reductase iron-sulfur subunit